MDVMTETLLAQGKHKNLYFYAFTATPKPKTLQTFGVLKSDGSYDAYHHYFDEYHFANPSLFASYYLNPDLEGYLNITSGERVRSIIKPLGIFRYTYMQKEENPRLEKLINIMEENILRMKEAR